MERLTALTDEQLVPLLAGADAEAAAAELFRRYRKKVYVWCFSYTHDREEAVDCAQEVFVRVFRGAAGFAGRARFSTWVYCVARNHCLGRLALRGEEWRRRMIALDDLAEREPAEDEAARIVREADVAGRLARLLEAAGRAMKDEELQAFVLHYREGLSVKEITRVLGCANPSGARTLIQTARRKFDRLLARKEFGDE